MVLEPAARAELSRSFLARSCSAVPSLPALLNPPRLPAGEVSRPHRFGREGAEGQREPCPLCFWRAKNPPGSGWVWCSYESRRQAVDDDSSTRRSRRSVTSVARLRALLRSSGGICIKSLSGISSYPEGPFRSSASALLCALRSPVREAAAA